MTSDRQPVPAVKTEQMPDDGTDRQPPTGRQLVALTSVIDEDGTQKTAQQIHDELLAQLAQFQLEESHG